MNRFGLCIAAAVVVVAACGEGVAPEEAKIKAPEPETADERQLLEALGYVNSVPVRAGAAQKVGVTLHQEDACANGWNLFNPRNESVARLMAMDGSVEHRWESGAEGAALVRIRELLPSHTLPYLTGWNHVEWLPDGGLLVVGAHHMLMRLDWESQVQWKLDLAAHHDVSVGSDGRIYALTDGVRTVEVDGETIAFQDNLVTVLSMDGELEREYSVYDALEEDLRAPMRQRLAQIIPAREERLSFLRERAGTGGVEERTFLDLYERATKGDVGPDEGVMNILFHNYTEDIFHANSVQVLERDAPELWRAGDLMLTLRRISSIVVLDHESGRSIWRWGGGILEAPHHATWLDDGNVLVFDNGIYRKHSRIVKMNPRTGEIVWQYVADPPGDFFSSARGGCQELANGNVLVAETDAGRAFEVTADGELVWEYHAPLIEGAQREPQRAAIYRMARITTEAVDAAAERRAADG